MVSFAKAAESGGVGLKAAAHIIIIIIQTKAGIQLTTSRRQCHLFISKLCCAGSMHVMHPMLACSSPFNSLHIDIDR